MSSKKRYPCLWSSIVCRLLLVNIVAGLNATGLAAARNPATPDPAQRGHLEKDDGEVRWIVDGKPVLDYQQPVLRLEDGTLLTWKTKTVEVEDNSATVSGAFTGEGEVNARWKYLLSDAGSRMECAVQVDWSLKQPVDTLQFGFGFHLDPRKRVFFAGQYGLGWETRYFYQFHLTALGTLMEKPDRNEWRWFGLEKNAGHGFRLWKAESDRTPPLVMQECADMPYATLLSDEAGAVLFDVAPAGEDAATRLLVDASGGGAATIEVVPPVQTAPGLLWSEAQRLKGRAEFTVTARTATGEAATAQLRDELKSRAPSDLAVLPGTGREWSGQDSAAPRARLVSAGFPFPQGSVTAGQAVQVHLGESTINPQVTPLAYWPDRSIKWGLLSFALPKVAGGEPAGEGPYLSFRDGSTVPVRVETSAAKEPAGENVATLKEGSRSEVHIQTGPLQAELTDGKLWWKSLVVEGKPLIAGGSGGVRAYADYKVDFQGWNSLDATMAGGTSDAADLIVEKITLEDNGPQRALVRLEGIIPNKEPTRCFLWLEFRAGHAGVRIYHTVEFLFKDPRRTALRNLGLEFTLGNFAPRSFASQGEVRQVTHPQDASMSLEQMTPNSFRLLSADNGSPQMIESGAKAEGWVLAAGKDYSVLAAVRNFSALAPKALGISAGSGDRLTVNFGLWPKPAGPMDVRRYSDYPHRGQSEQASSQYDWVEKSYYPYDPFVGVSRSHELLLDFLPAGGEGAARDIAADFESPVLLAPGARQLAQSKVILPGYTASAGKFAGEGMENFLKFWLFHQNLHQWMGFWNFGDFRHYFRAGYGWIAKPEALAAAVKRLAAGEEAKSITLDKADYKLDYVPPNDWAYDNGRWGWGNTEGSPGLLLQTEYLRSGSRDVFFAAEAMARHARDVVVRHAGRWFGAGTRHGVQHWSDGNHEERQTAASEFKYHYFLTGDPRTRQVIDRLYDKYYSRTPVSVHAAHSGRLQGLLFHWEVTGDPAEGEQLKRYVECMLSPEGIYEEADVVFPGPTRKNPPKGLNGGSMFFQVFGALSALLEYELITGHPGLHRSLIASADSVTRNPKALENYKRGKVSPMLFGALGYAARHAEDPSSYQKLLKEAFEAAFWKYTFAMVPRDKAFWTGDKARLALTVPGSLFWMNFAPWVWGALDAGTLSDPAWEARIEDYDKTAKIAAVPPLSWQSEYDAVEGLDAYLNQAVPWKTSGEPAPSEK